MKKIIIGLLSVIFLFFSCKNNEECNKTKDTLKVEKGTTNENIVKTVETLKIESANGIILNADYYKTETSNKTMILLFHQAGFSRGEYIETAPKFNDLGYNCLAIDQRSGKEVNGIENEAYKQAVEKGLETKYADAFVDLEATLNYVLDNKLTENVILIGSSYSSSLIFILASRHKENVVGMLSFSPGEYFEFEGKTIADYAKDVECPVFITSAKNEKSYWEGIFEAVTSEKTSFLPEFEGIHGSRALWSDTEGNEKYWAEVEKFLSKL